MGDAMEIHNRISLDQFALVPGEVRSVKYAPWQVGNETWVIGLQGISGGYALCRTTRHYSDGQRALKKGDQIDVKEPNGQMVVRHVERAPWQVSTGAWVVGIAEHDQKAVALQNVHPYSGSPI